MTIVIVHTQDSRIKTVECTMYILDSRLKTVTATLIVAVKNVTTE